MTPKQTAFVAEYLIDLNASAAARRAGYSPKTADRTGYENLRKPEIAAAIQEAMQERAKRTEVTADRVLSELALLAFSNMADYIRITSEGDPYIDLSDLTREQAAALTEATIHDYKDGRGPDARDVRQVRIKLGDKKSALELLGKHLGLFTDKVENTHKFDGFVGVDIHVEEPGDSDDDPED